MWLAGRFNHLLLRRSCVIIANHSINTHCACNFPRGYNRYDNEQRLELPHREVLGAGEPFSNEFDVPLKTDIDAQPSDSVTVDPVLLKYTNMLKDMERPASVENLHATSFGSIRFDNENIPKMHGQFDSENKLETMEKSNQADHNVPKLLGESSELGIEVQKNEDVEDINALYFLNEADSVNNNEMNYVDKVFSEPFARYQNYSQQKADLSSSCSTSTREDKDRNNPENELSSHGDLNYVDKVFFGNSLETLDENRKSPPEFSEIEKELEASLGIINAPKRIGKASTSLSDECIVNTGRPKSSEIREDLSKDAASTNKKVEINDTVAESLPNETSMSAYDYIVKKRKEEHSEMHHIKSGDGSKKSYKRVLSLLSKHSKRDVSKFEMLKKLRSSIIYNQYDVVGLYKPYGVSMHPGTDSEHHALTDFLPDLAASLKMDSLYPVHRLDATTTGILLLAQTATMADTLKQMFMDRQVQKTYWTITKGIPNPTEGVIDIPIAEGLIDGRRRMVLKPDIKDLKSTTRKSQLAVTEYKVKSGRFNTALVACRPKTGVKHQLRVHLGFGLGCPVLGDHKYSHLKKLAPQRLPGDALDHLRLKQSRVRDLPVFLHSRSVVLPGLADGKDIFILAQLPAFFNKAIELLHLNRKESQILVQKLSNMS